MKRPAFQRNNPKVRRVREPPPGVDLAVVAESCCYVGSPYHKDRPGFAGMPHGRRPDASICPGHLASRRRLVQGWLREAIRNGQVGTWNGGYPKYVWFRDGETVYEARQGSPGSAKYHGYPLQPEHEVRGLE
jgi:hypothetical protein